jgi:hypothetical protein
MNGPSTQDSPKVAWPARLEMAWSEELGLVGPVTPTAAAKHSYLTETYIPVSALLSDEVVRALLARKLPAGPIKPSALLVNRLRDGIRADLQAAIEQVGGGQVE